MFNLLMLLIALIAFATCFSVSMPALAAPPTTQCVGGAVQACVASAVVARRVNKQHIIKYQDTS